MANLKCDPSPPMRQLVRSIICLAFLLCPRCAVAWAAQAQSQPQPASTRQRKSIISNNSNGGGGYALRRRNNIVGDKNSDDGSDVQINVITGDEMLDSSRELQNKITSNHIIQLEFSGVTYASMSLDVVKADLVDVVEDVLNAHLGNDMEVVDVKPGDCSPNCRKLRSSSQRMLSYIRLVVSISLRHSPWISAESALATTIEIVSEYVDNDFRRYMRSLPGNGDYVGTVDVSDYYGNAVSISMPSSGEPESPSTTEPDLSAGLPSTTEPIISDKDGPKPTQAPTKVIIPANDWMSMAADTLETKIPWWGWFVLVVGVAFIVSCCCCILYTRRKRVDMTRKPTTVTDTIQVREPTKEPIRSTSRRGSVDFVENKKKNKKPPTKYDGEKDKSSQSLTLVPLQIPAQQLLYDPNPTSDMVLYEPNINAPDPDERIQEHKKKKKKKKKKQKKPKDP